MEIVSHLVSGLIYTLICCLVIFASFAFMLVVVNILADNGGFDPKPTKINLTLFWVGVIAVSSLAIYAWTSGGLYSEIHTDIYNLLT